MRLTNKKLESLIKEERKASKMYKRYGLPGIARQEKKHHDFLKKKLERRRK